MTVWELVQSVSDYFKVNIIVFDDIKEKKIHGSISGLNLESTLDTISWYIGVEWQERQGIYYLGGNAKNVIVFDSAGIDKSLESVFDSGKVKILKDKIIISGTERDLTKISNAIKEITDRSYVKIRLRVFEVSSDKNLDIGIDIDKSIQYAVDFKNILKDIDPITHLSMSAIASLKANCDYFESQSLIDSDVGLLTGEDVTIHIGQQYDRTIYTQTSQGQYTPQGHIISGFSSQITGLLLKLKAFKQDSNWFFKVNIENSTAKSQYEKASTSLDTYVKITDKNVVLLAELNRDQENFSYDKGIPFLSDIPILGWLFRVTHKSKLYRKVYFTVQIID
ncbi:MAG: hypothetical protein PHS65_04025 [Arcobacteraceae bacterium]|nr:hypothetical protein [Arcobacteraceae bacterium]